MFQVMCKLWLCNLSMCQECTGGWSRLRGCNGARWASNGIRERMTFNENSHAVLEPATTVARFSRFLGMIECSLFPINTKDWRSFYTGTNMDKDKGKAEG